MNPLHKADMSTAYLHPAELRICRKPTRVITVLGSCVSVTFFNPRLKIGAICHGTLPLCRAMGECNGICIEAFKYMDCALKYILKNFRDHGVSNSELVVKIFGGADTLRSKRSNTIGSQNVKIALDIIEAERLRVAAADVGDSFGRKLVFYSHTGDVYLKRLREGNFKAASG